MLRSCCFPLETCISILILLGSNQIWSLYLSSLLKYSTIMWWLTLPMIFESSSSCRCSLRRYHGSCLNLWVSVMQHRHGTNRLGSPAKVEKHDNWYAWKTDNAVRVSQTSDVFHGIAFNSASKHLLVNCNWMLLAGRQQNNSGICCNVFWHLQDRM